MPNLKKYKETKSNIPELNAFLTVGAFDPFTRKKKKNNPKQPKEGKKIENTERKPTDFHSDMEKKIDALITNIGKETKTEEQSSIYQKKLENDSKNLAETREHFRKKPETPYFKTEIKPENDFDSFDAEDELFAIKSPSKIQSESKIVKSSEEPKKDILNSMTAYNEYTNDKNILDQTSGEHDVARKHSIISFTHHIKIRSKEERKKLKDAKEKSKTHDTTPLSENLKFKVEKKETGTDNIFTKTERGLEETKIENEIKELTEHNNNKLKKLELKKAKKEAIAKEKELEIKRLEEEKKRKLELKKARRMEKIKVKNFVNSNQQSTPINKILEHKWKKYKEHKEKNNSQTPEMDTLIAGKKEMEKEDSILDEDIKKILLMTDNLLGNLPEEVIDEFVKSKDFALYEKVINKYKIK
ncbi:hypothetical protein MBGDC06_00559 [Thermoplasmatales archaeon SCGC AB-539-C06]|nr:hypothetical protein MBGDC06_00559 [Thermoplasmatales archaeon SCGC AB-539-C06]